MVGLLIWKEQKSGKREKAVTMEERRILQVRFLCAEILKTERTPETVMRRRIAAAGRRWKKLGISQVVLPEEFSYGQELGRIGILPVSTLSLRQALAADWVRWLLAEMGTAPAGARVGVSADRLTGEVVRTVTELALRHRYVLLDLPYGGEELCRRLRREFGVSLLLGPSVEQLEGAEVWVQFSPREGSPGSHVLRLYEEQSFLPVLTLPPTLEAQLPSGTNRGQLLSVLRESGAIPPGQIAVGGAKLAKKEDFLADSPP